MERRFSTRDVSLTLRMLAVMLLGFLLYCAILAGLVVLSFVEPGWTPYIIFFAIVIISATAMRYQSASGLMLAAVGAERIDAGQHSTLQGTVERLAALADVPTPRLAIVDAPISNAFSVGVRRRSATIVVTTELQRLLEPAEVEAVLGHELAHIANRDAGVMTIAAVPRTLGETMIGEQGAIFYLWFVVWWVAIPIWALGSLITLTLSRYREFAADRGSALLTGRPAELMSALVKLNGRDATIPDDDLRRLSAVEALCVVPNGRTRFSIFSDHPPLEKRLARLEAMARVQGKPVGP